MKGRPLILLRLTTRLSRSSYGFRETVGNHVCTYYKNRVDSGVKFFSTAPATVDPSGSASLEIALKNIKDAFPNRSGLYSRIDTVISNTKTPRIGIIPFNCSRYEMKTFLEALLADPLASDQVWFEAFKERLLTKDVLVKWAPVFEYVGNKNSLVEYPVPFHLIPKDGGGGENTQILEVNSLEDSMEHLKDCHFHIFVTKDLKDVLSLLTKSQSSLSLLSSSLPSSEYPSVLVVDLEEGLNDIDLLESNKDTEINQTKTNQSSQATISRVPNGTIVVSSRTALKAIDKLIVSSANASEYLKGWRQSRMSTVEEIVFSDIPQLNRQLVDSIISTCEKIVEPTLKSHAEEQAKAGTIEMVKMREKWAQGAHRELQTTLSDSLNALQNSDLAWWKLYYKVDDIYDITTQTLYRNFLPLSRDKLEYCLGRIDQRAIEIYGSVPETVETSGTTEIFDAQTSLAGNEAVSLHDKGLKLLTTTFFGIQLPLTLVPLLGIYFYDYSLYAMGSITALGMVVGLRYLQKGWLTATDEFNTSVKIRARQVLTSCERLIWKSYESKVLEQQKLASRRVELIENVREATRK